VPVRLVHALLDQLRYFARLSLKPANIDHNFLFPGDVGHAQAEQAFEIPATPT
jgi:hypothetical protein